ncbi:MAG: hypothetical protein JWP87_5517 [Labilithrix sp.]|jgi:hypothetical protein|nr:hypothetical protein [Labilithrix sp.]
MRLAAAGVVSLEVDFASKPDHPFECECAQRACVH